MTTEQKTKPRWVRSLKELERRLREPVSEEERARRRAHRARPCRAVARILLALRFGHRADKPRSHLPRVLRHGDTWSPSEYIRAIRESRQGES